MDKTNQPVKEEEKIEETPVDEAPIAEDAPVVEETAAAEEAVVTEEVSPSEAEPAQEAQAEESVEAKDEETPVEEEPVVEETKEDSKPADEAKVTDNPDAKWYIIHTYAGHENKVARSLKQRMEAMGFSDRIFDIVVPTKDTIKVSQGKKETVKEKIFPGYVLVKMVLDDESWFLVRSTQGVTSFIGAGSKPTPISEEEVKAIQKFMTQSTPTFQTNFTVGEAVKITDGPFNDFLGTIDSIDDARGKVHVLVSIFGRETPVELDFLQVKKI